MRRETDIGTKNMDVSKVVFHPLHNPSTFKFSFVTLFAISEKREGGKKD